MDDDEIEDARLEDLFRGMTPREIVANYVEAYRNGPTPEEITDPDLRRRGWAFVYEQPLDKVLECLDDPELRAFYTALHARMMAH